MRDVKEVQRAHDIITSVLAGETGIVSYHVLTDSQSKLAAEVVRGVLCWILEHKNPAFPKYLAGMEELLEGFGYILVNTEETNKSST